jgi:hypothetical protein
VQRSGAEAGAQWVKQRFLVHGDLPYRGWFCACYDDVRPGGCVRATWMTLFRRYNSSADERQIIWC